ncbi:hypothetical protein [Saccharibacillus sp. JS10]|uniref:hypothetical protein n=1 Tax=Saccharibacillus sp. JS10 TaxID=2950552 RepID=UPI00210A9CE2|nr:hypothetical protein [Saccharibacillus sp. JS10]MCQ4087498.1 hypothetical protein [Saccharibacillus sp. JS10]
MRNQELRRPKKFENRTFWLWIVGLILLAVGIRIAVALPHGGFMSDQQLFVDWMEQVRKHGLLAVYIEGKEINYPPVFLLIMNSYRVLVGLFGIVPVAGELSFKGVLIAIDLIVLLCAIPLTRASKQKGTRLFVLGLLALNPALIFGSASWGQVDMLHSMLMASTLLLLPTMPVFAGVLFAVALLSKFQAITLLAILGMYFLRLVIQKRTVEALLRFGAGFFGVLGITVILFAQAGGLYAMVKGAYLSAVGMYPQVTMNAMNIWYYFIGVSPSTLDTTHVLGFLTLRSFGFLLLGIVVAFAAVYLWRSRLGVETLLKSAALVNFSFFMLPTEIHERYSVPALMLSIFVGLYDRRWWLPTVLLSVSVTVNLWMVQTGNIGVYSGLVVVYINVALLLWMIVTLFFEIKKGILTRSVPISIKEKVL